MPKATKQKAANTYRKLTAKWGKPKAKSIDVILDCPVTARNFLNTEKCVEDWTKDGTHRSKVRYWCLQVKEPNTSDWKFVMHVIYWIPTDNPGDKIVRFLGPVGDAIKECVPIMDEMVHQYGKNSSHLEFRLLPVDVEYSEYLSACVDLNLRYSRMTIINDR